MLRLGESIGAGIGGRRLRLTCGAFGILVLGACSGPVGLSVADIEDSESAKFAEPPSIAKALAYADAVRSTYRSRISNQMLLRQGVGLGSIAALAGLGFIATRGGSADLAYGLGSGVAGGLAATQLFTSNREQFLYAAGAVTIGCAMSAVAPLQSASVARDTLRRGILDQPLINDINAVEGMIEAMSQAGAESTNLARSRAAVAKAREAVVRGTSALLRLDGAGADLVRVVDEVQDKITTEVIANQVDLAAFIGSLGATFAVQVPTPKTAAPAAAPGLIETSQAGALELEAATKELIRRTSALEAAADFIEAAGASVSLTDCTFDPDAVGGGFRLDPSTPQTVDATARDQTVNFALSGGRPPYRFNWLGTAPPATVEPDLETGAGDLAITVPKDTPSGTYAFRVGDVASAVAFSQLVIQGPSAAPQARLQNGGATDSCATDPKGIGEVQKTLRDDFRSQGMRVDVTTERDGQTVTESKEIGVDCKMGPVTRAALQEALRKIGTTPADVAAMDDDALLAKYKELKGLGS